MPAREHFAGQAETIVAGRVAVLKARHVEPQRATVESHSAVSIAPLPVDHQYVALPFMKLGEGETGFLLSDRSLKPIYTNGAANSILCYPNASGATANPAVVQERIRSILPVEPFITGLSPASFLSGRRRYTCRSFVVESHDNSAPAMVALVLERRPRDPIDLVAVSRHFHLSPRESETVLHLIHGLTTKEVAQRMGVSPNTVKQFVRLIMSKMGVTTRSGIVGKLIRG